MARIESDSLGKVEVPEDKLWGAQTQRSLENFKIGQDTFPFVLIKNFAILKKSAAIVNGKKGEISKDKADLISSACDEIISGKLGDNFPLKVWQTGSGTQTNMNLNEVIANKAALLANKEIGKNFIHPNDEVNRGQSSNDTFPTAMQMACVEAAEEFVSFANDLIKTLGKKEKAFRGQVKIGRTHLMDAVPMTVGQEFSAWKAQLEQAVSRIELAIDDVKTLPIGGTAIGTGLNASKDFDENIVKQINKITGNNFRTIENKFSKIAAHDDIASLSSALKNYSLALMKLANDIRWLGSGPRCGLAELLLPANEPGSSIMPGKVNPTQCEAVTMVCAQVVGNDTAVTIGAGHGQLQLNAFKPLMVHNTLSSIELLKDAGESFRVNCLEGIEINKAKLEEYLERSLMLVTALTPILGYEKCSKIAQAAYKNGTTIREEVLSEKLMSEDEFNKATDLSTLT